MIKEGTVCILSHCLRVSKQNRLLNSECRALGCQQPSRPGRLLKPCAVSSPAPRCRRGGASILVYGSSFLEVWAWERTSNIAVHYAETVQA